MSDPVLDQTPGHLDIDIVAGDSFSQLLDFDISLAGYTFAANFNDDSGLQTIAVAPTDLPNGKITLSMTAVATALLDPGEYRWRLIWTLGAEIRTVLAGILTVEEK